VAVADRPPPTPTHVAVHRNRSNQALPALLGVVIAVALIVLAIVLLMHFNNGNSHAHAPWSNQDAPNVRPTPITDQ
jgi:flagellar basal body-associated protein FliL